MQEANTNFVILELFKTRENTKQVITEAREWFGNRKEDNIL